MFIKKNKGTVWKFEMKIRNVGLINKQVNASGTTRHNNARLDQLTLYEESNEMYQNCA